MMLENFETDNSVRDLGRSRQKVLEEVDAGESAKDQVEGVMMENVADHSEATLEETPDEGLDMGMPSDLTEEQMMLLE